MWAIKEYRENILRKMDLQLKPDGILLDIGCGSGEFTSYLKKVYNVNVIGVDLNLNLKCDLKNEDHISFLNGSIFSLPLKSNSCDYIFLKDILHHIDEPNHNINRFKLAFNELKRLIKPNGKIIVLEANRYNPISYLFMVRVRGHDHLKYNQLNEIIRSNFNQFASKSFESHVYPVYFYKLFKIYERIMDNIMVEQYRMYRFYLINLGKEDA